MKSHPKIIFNYDGEHKLRLKRVKKSSWKIKNVKTYFVIFILLWCFSIKLQGIPVLSNERDEKEDKIIRIHSSGSNSATIQWTRLWGLRGGIGGLGVAVDSFGNVYNIGHRGGYYVVDSINENFLAKYDSSGVQQWNRTWGGGYLDEKGGVAVDSSDNVYVAGNTYGMSGFEGHDMILMKYDSSGEPQWNRTWGGDGWDDGRAVVVDSSDNVYLAGIGDWDMALVKYDSSGVQQWNRTWGGVGENKLGRGNGVAVDSSDNVYLAGIGDWNGDGGMILVKYDSSGVLQWNRTWGGSDRDKCNGVVVDSSDNVYLTGSTNSFGLGGFDMVLVKYDSSGVQQWNRTWGGSDRDESSGVAVDLSDNVYLTGSTDSFGVDSGNMILVKYNSSGDQQWYRIFEWIDSGSGVAVDSSDVVYISGTALSRNTILVKYIISNITINFPNQFSFYGNVSPNFDISTFDSNLDSTWYSLDGGLVNITFSGSIGAIDQTEWDKQEEGIVDINFYANNTMGKEEYVEVSVIKDTYKPIITIVSPLQNEKFGVEAPSYLISIEEPNSASLIIEANDQWASWTIVRDNYSHMSGELLQFKWRDLPQGEINITFYVTDITGKIGSASVIVIKILEPDLEYFPFIVIISAAIVGVSVFIIYKNRKMFRKPKEDLDFL